MASNLHHSLCEVKGEVKLQATSTISRMVKQQPGKLRLSQMGDSFYIQCVYDNGIKPSKKYKVCRIFCCHCLNIHIFCVYLDMYLYIEYYELIQ